MTSDMAAFGIELAFRSTVLLAAAYIGAHMLRRRPAVERHLLWVVATCGVLMLPLLSLGVPEWRVQVAAPSWLATGPIVEPAARFDVADVPSVETDVAVVPRGLSDAEPRWAPDPAAADLQNPATRTLPPIPVVWLVWLAGALTIGGALALSFARVHRLSTRARSVADPALLALAHETRSELLLRRPVRLLEGDVDTMPMTFGLFRSSLLLPSVAHGWPAARQRAVLRHELAHIARRDAWTQLVAELCCVLHWYNPLVWLAARRLHLEREHACDDVVLAAGSRPTEYAAELVEIARTMRARRGTAVAAVAMARDSQLRTRTLALLDGRRRSARLSHRLLMPAWLGAVALITTLASLAPDFARPVPDGPSQSGIVTPLPVFGAALRSGPGTIPTPHSPPPAPTAPQPTSASWVGAGPDRGTIDCLSGGRSNSMHSNSTDSRRTIKWSGRDCSGEVVIEGDVEFDASFTTITGISRGGQFRIDVEEGTDRRQLVIRPADGGLTYDYRVAGQRSEFDAAARRWLDEQLLFLFRRVGFMAEQRARALLARGGHAAVLAEVEHLQSDHARAAYLGVAVGDGRLDESSLRRVLALAGSTLSSDHYRTNVITAAAGRYTFTDGMRTTYIDAVSGLNSDHYRHAAFAALLENGQLSPAQVAAVLNESERVKSDHYRARLLGELSGRYGSMPEIRPAYLRAAAGISSDHYKHVVLASLLENGNLTAADQAGVVQAATTIRSDHYRRQLLSGMTSDRKLNAAVLMAVLDAARTINSDHHKAELLIEIADTHELDDATRARMLDVMESIRSKSSRGRVAEALLRAGR